MIKLLRSLSGRVAVFLLLSILLTVGLTVSVTHGIYSTQLRNESLKLSQILVKQTINSMVYAMTQQPPKSVDEVLSWMAQDKVRGVRLIGEDGQISHSSRLSEIGSRVDLNVADELHLGEWSLHNEVQGDRSLLIVHKPVSNEPRCKSCHGDQNYKGLLEVQLDITEIQHSATRAKLVSVALITVSVALAMALGFWLVGRFMLRPLNQLVDGMRRVERGDFETELRIDSPVEFAELCDRFNSMVTHLRETQGELDRYYEENMARAERLATVGEMATTMAHEIRNPLAGLSGALQVLRHDPALASKRDIIDEMLNTLDRLAGTSQDLLNFAAPPLPNFEHGDVNDSLRSVLSLIRQHKPKTGAIDIVETLTADLPELLADHRQLQQVFLNICLNAVQAMPNGGSLQVASHLENGQRPARVVVDIRDDGPGISPELRDKIFTPFFTTKHRGTGLGLAISQRIVARHGGELQLCQDEASGSHFSIWLPLRTNDEIIPESQSSPPAQSPPSESTTSGSTPT